MSIGRLQDVPLREVWPNEAADFTPWLLQNAEALGDALGIELEIEAAEHAVGGFSLDLVGRDLTHDCALIVENQIEGTDHSHLGQLLTYAGGVAEVGTVVWIAQAFREEHRQALDWLNEHTDESVRVFGVALRAVRIGDSMPAPLFDVVAKPNDWQKRVRATTRPAGERERAYEEFWGALLDRLRADAPGLVGGRAKVPTSPYLSFRSSIPNATVYATFGQRHARVELYIDSGDAARNAEIFGALLERRAEIEAGYGGPLEFEAAEHRQIRKVLTRLETPASAVLVPEVHGELRAWFADVIPRFVGAFEAAARRG
ncbi:DUF4268 domain-containing protein [Miltoncostaea marina]|uniref:DUF4268 domain-containing protein n=1 Tax=Miltoncostaea marina TaxID=2843215 RepID=UPI001C3CF9D4|nr:DUF4268 domain-containing protein [Miltoncostaea marina]